jgi:hypothetical protein
MAKSYCNFALLYHAMNKDDIAVKYSDKAISMLEHYSARQMIEHFG